MESMRTDLSFAFVRGYTHRFMSIEKTTPQNCWGCKKPQNDDHKNRYHLRLLPESGYRGGLWGCASGSLLGAAGIWPGGFEECPRSSKGPACGWKATRGSAAGSPAPSGPVSSDPEVLWPPADCCSNLCRRGVAVTAGEQWPGVKFQVEKANRINVSNSGEFYFPYCDTSPNKTS